jgi:hypothetical protein
MIKIIKLQYTVRYNGHNSAVTKKEKNQYVNINLERA